MTDRLALRGLRVFARHGVWDHEADEGQDFLIDVNLTIDEAAAARSDDLADTVDYGSLAQAIHDVVASERWNLIETVAERVAVTCLDRSAVQAVTVTVHKPQAPIPVPFDDVLVTITRAR